MLILRTCRVSSFDHAAKDSDFKVEHADTPDMCFASSGGSDIRIVLTAGSSRVVAEMDSATARELAAELLRNVGTAADGSK